MDNMRPEQVMSGTEGELWIDGDYMAEITEFSAKIELKTAQIKQVKKRYEGTKVMGYAGKGTVKLNKVSSYFIKKMSNNIKNGRQTVCTIISKLDDPDAIGEERIVIKDATFTNLILADWQAEKVGEETYNFTFGEYEILNMAL